jgi:hypothetical protein
MWAFSFERIWHTQFKPLLDEAYKLAHSVDPPDMPKTEVREVDAASYTGEACDMQEQPDGGGSC